MSPLARSLLTRNAVVALAFVALLTGLRFVPFRYNLPFPVLLVAFSLSLLWANMPLARQHRWPLAVLLCLVLLPALGYPIAISSFLLDRTLADCNYMAHGFQMVSGCNGAAANSAEFEIHELDERLEQLAGTPGVDTNVIIKLRILRPVVQEKVTVLDEDCATRGHCEDHPWKTNWSGTRKTLDLADQELFK
jgi:hypothetical protein